ncbi:glutamine synthetase [Streptomyces sp. NPDC048723]
MIWLVGRGVHDFLRNKKQEWEEYRSEVTAFELRKNLPVL